MQQRLQHAGCPIRCVLSWHAESPNHHHRRSSAEPDGEGGRDAVGQADGGGGGVAGGRGGHRAVGGGVVVEDEARVAVQAGGLLVLLPGGGGLQLVQVHGLVVPLPGPPPPPAPAVGGAGGDLQLAVAVAVVAPLVDPVREDGRLLLLPPRRPLLPLPADAGDPVRGVAVGGRAQGGRDGRGAGGLWRWEGEGGGGSICQQMSIGSPTDIDATSRQLRTYTPLVVISDMGGGGRVLVGGVSKGPSGSP